VASNLSVKKHI